MTQREQGHGDDKGGGGRERDEDKQFKREPRPSDRERDEDEDEDKNKDPGAGRTERDPGDSEDEDERDEDEDRSAASSEDDGDVDEETRRKRERRRQEKREKRERERRERAQDKETIRELREKYASLEQRLNRGEVEGRQQRIEDDLEEAEQAIKTLRSMRRKAIEAVDADAIDDLDEKLYRARSRKDQLVNEREALKRRPRERVADDALVRHANSFMREHSWYDPQQATDDEDSLIVQSIDRRLIREGHLDPNSAAYWDELRERVKKHPRLKHRFGRRSSEDDNEVDQDRDEDKRSGTRDRDRRGGPPVGGRGNGRGDGSGFQLTEEHKHALREAGIEPGTKRYSNMIDEFKRAHKQQREARSQA